MAYHIIFVSFYGYQKTLRYGTLLSKFSQRFIDLIDVITSQGAHQTGVNTSVISLSCLNSSVPCPNIIIAALACLRNKIGTYTSDNNFLTIVTARVLQGSSILWRCGKYYFIPYIKCSMPASHALMHFSAVFNDNAEQLWH